MKTSSTIWIGYLLVLVLFLGEAQADVFKVKSEDLNEDIEHIVVKPTERKYDTPLFFLHGLVCTADYWEQFMGYFADLGYEVHAINLPGRGKSSLNKGHINKYGAKDYQICLNQTIEGISPQPVLVTHSLGGFLALKYIESNELPGVVLIASYPHTGASKLMFRMFRKHPIKLLCAMISRNLQIPSAEIAGELFFSDPPPIDLEKYYQEQSVADSMKVSTDMVFRVRLYPEKVTTPTFVMIGDRDFIYSVEEQRGLAEALGADFLVLQGQAHNVMLEAGWQQTAHEIHKWISERLKLP